MKVRSTTREGVRRWRSRALELSGGLLAAVVEEEAEVDGEVEMDTEDVGLERSAKAHSCLEVDEAVEQRAALARLLRKLAHPDLDQAIKHVGAGGELEGVDGALAVGRARGGLGATGVTSTGEREEEEIESEEEGN
ncbi:hypothetical protein MUK42_20301 [Musa troglodytarum]|uniref:Uncharacterized protein n=1 Tax=Musa troglodytarum TaxID=320322 RepID=A0A9E7FUT1_9LILI|nr:hypothetical protein MUK42_20301 [Musa troglodytarum]